MNSIKFKFSYSIGSDIKTLEFKDSIENQDFKAFVFKENKVVSLKIVTERCLKIQELRMIKDFQFAPDSRLFLNGYQSWTDSRELTVSDKMRGINFIPKFIVDRFSLNKYGDYDFKEYQNKIGILHGFSYAYVRNHSELDFVGSLTERNGYTIINFDIINSKIIIEKDCKGLEIDKEYTPFEIAFLKGSEKTVFDEYFSLMNIEKPKVQPKTGYTSWYNHYQNINEKKILDNLEAVYSFEDKLDIFQIDDGYQTAVGDWLLTDKTKFPNGMKEIADKISEKDLIPGLWLAPFSCENRSELFKKHPDWVLNDEKGDYVKAGSNWSGFYTLDIYNENVREYIRNVFDTILNDWGYGLVKLDFLYSVCLIPQHNKTRGQVMCEAMDFLRECVGDKLILGCGVPLAPAFGKVDFCRIGADVSLDWDDKLYMKLIHRERVSTKSAVRNSIYRRHLNGRAFLNDPDVFLLRDDNIKMSNSQKRTLSFVNGLFGCLLFTSDNVSKYNESHKELFVNTLELQGATDIVVTDNNNCIIIEYSLFQIRHKVKIDIINGKMKEI